MEKLALVVSQTIPEGFPSEVLMPGYFLNMLNTPEGIAAVRFILAAAAILFILQWIHCEKQASKEEK